MNNNVTIKVTKETSDVIENLFWLFGELPEGVMMSSSKTGLTLFKDEKRLDLEIHDA